MYHPGLGRFLQMDPMGLQTEGEKLTAGQKALYGAGTPEAFGSPEMNLYRYCGDDPLDRRDPTGLYWGIDPKMSDKYKERTLDQIARARAMDSRIDDRFRAMERDSSKMDVFTDAGPEGNHVETRYDWLGNPKGATIYYSPDNWKAVSGYRDPVIGLFHELPHIPYANRGDVAKLYSPAWLQQEAEAIRFENIARAYIDGSRRDEDAHNTGPSSITYPNP